MDGAGRESHVEHAVGLDIGRQPDIMTDHFEVGFVQPMADICFACGVEIVHAQRFMG